ncbi:RNA polymerase sigma-70 factor, ECF subfamily [Reichenbachiella agariperforans]|uniref:RNA polymerase sigma-70 factor, ECF subfamily n=1 Tax=Reichenbachiella agariperforans TaxID=156994 RepID=A0A1M6J2U2_REIAG|nr:sigma-70 family RNA polymerase sigma factor [Reichenbachiella agariperforans]SHJ41025.1 RNA polymerase sigma-70 factor, ECF subfamily [Reichenbachiella agariperforans]
MIDQQKLTEIFKTEYSNLIAVLSNYYGLKDLQLAEDIVSETFLKAMKAWSHKGIPQYPRAWLRKVAQNLYYEDYRRLKNFKDKISKEVANRSEEFESIEITEKLIEDSQLRMIFLLCHPELNREAQLCIALRILCGFSTEEIAKALLSNKESVNKKLYRAKKTLQGRISIEEELTASDYQDRLDNVLRVIYLVFNEGYYSSTTEENIRNELCWEAMRLGIFLSNQRHFEVDHVQALIALMCFQASRLKARQSGGGGDLRYDEQDQSQWDQELIQKGLQYLKMASKGERVSKYHLEATIAFWHTQDQEGKWEQILMLYNKLLTLEYSSIIAMNRSYALAKAQSPHKAIEEALKLGLQDNVHYFCLLAELYRMDENIDLEINHLNKALKLVKKESETTLIQRKLEIALSKV